MTREEAKEFYPILQAYAEGKVIECRRKPSTMESADTPNGWTEIKEIEFWNNTEYRIKPESAYRPFDNAQECIEEMQKHQPFGWIKPNIGKEKYIITVIIQGYYDIKINENFHSFKYIFENFTFADGTPFGKLE